jgi:hypothetical protein
MDSYTTLILEEAENLYNKLTTELIGRIIAATAAAIRATLSPQLDNNRLKLTHKNDNTCLMEEPRYNNNQQEISNKDQERSNKQQIT